MLKFFKKDKGFTLIELLVVIAIIAVLASIVLVSLNTARIKGRDARRVADIKSLQVALELYYDGVGAGTYPTTLSLLKDNGYIPAIPKDPKNTTVNYAYGYCSGPSAQKAYHLGALMEGISASEGALATDVDQNSVVGSYSTGFTSKCGASTVWATGFDGEGAGDATACNDADDTGTDKCYDVTN